MSEITVILRLYQKESEHMYIPEIFLSWGMKMTLEEAKVARVYKTVYWRRDDFPDCYRELFRVPMSRPVNTTYW